MTQLRQILGAAWKRILGRLQRAETEVEHGLKNGIQVMEASDSQPVSTEASAPEEIYLSVEEIERLKILLGKKQHEPKTAFGRLIISFFRFLDLMLDNTSRAWMYLLEVVGALSVFMFVWMFADGIHIIKHATDEKTIQKGQALIDAVKIAAESTNLIIGGLCVALPALIGMLRARKRTSP